MSTDVHNGSIDVIQQAIPGQNMDQLFAQLAPDTIEHFYQAYQHWLLRQRRESLQTQIATLQQKIDKNAGQIQQVTPSALALASLVQFQSYGVEDIDLLDRMLTRGDTWLDHSLQLLLRCEQLDLIGNNYTEWCEHALEGAYDWIESMGETFAPEEPETASDTHTTMAGATETQFLQKLMQEEGSTDLAAVQSQRRTTQPLPRITAPLPRITAPLPALALDNTAVESDTTENGLITIIETPDEIAQAPGETALHTDETTSITHIDEGDETLSVGDTNKNEQASDILQTDNTDKRRSTPETPGIPEISESATGEKEPEPDRKQPHMEAEQLETITPSDAPPEQTTPSDENATGENTLDALSLSNETTQGRISSLHIDKMDDTIEDSTTQTEKLAVVTPIEVGADPTPETTTSESEDTKIKVNALAQVATGLELAAISDHPLPGSEIVDADAGENLATEDDHIQVSSTLAPAEVEQHKTFQTDDEILPPVDEMTPENSSVEDTIDMATDMQAEHEQISPDRPAENMIDDTRELEHQQSTIPPKKRGLLQRLLRGIWRR